MITPSSAYWPLTPNSWAEYNYFTFGAGRYNPTTMGIEIDKAPVLTDQFRRTCVAVQHIQYPGIAICDTRPGVVPLPDWSNVDKVLFQGLYNGPGNPQYIGESGNDQDIGWIPECEITTSPITGEVLTGTCTGNMWDKTTGAVQSSAVNWKYKTIGPGPGVNGVYWWPQYPDQIMTALIERPEQSAGWVYNYIFARNVGLINFWWGWKRADNTMDPAQSWEWQITSHS